jgi:hypothetical protein
MFMDAVEIGHADALLPTGRQPAEKDMLSLVVG